jgi:hypothetical protein
LAGVTAVHTTITLTIRQALVVLVVERHITHTTRLELLDRVMLVEQVQRLLDTVLVEVAVLVLLVKTEQPL